MLSFKQYIQQYPNGHKTKKTNHPFSLRQLKQSRPAKLQEGDNSYADKSQKANIVTMSKWDLIKLIAKDEGETVAVKPTGDGIYFDFVSVEIESN